jgi:hypothetical protein
VTGRAAHRARLLVHGDVINGEPTPDQRDAFNLIDTPIPLTLT